MHTCSLEEVAEIGHFGGLVVMHSAASAKGLGFNSQVTRAYLRFNSRASTLAGTQC